MLKYESLLKQLNEIKALATLEEQIQIDELIHLLKTQQGVEKKFLQRLKELADKLY